MPNLKIKISLPLALFLLASSGGIKAQITDDTPIKVNTVLLNIPVIATGNNANGLKKENFLIYQDGERQTVEFFADQGTPLNVAILIDTSGSTRKVIREIKDAARGFVKNFRPEDRGMILSFDSTVRVLANLTSDQNKLRSGINSADIDREGGSRMHDAIYRVATDDFVSLSGRKAVIVLTDGWVSGKVSSEKLLNILTESDTLVYPIFFQTVRLFPLGSEIKTITMNELLKTPPVDFLNAMALATGGRVYCCGLERFSRGVSEHYGRVKKTIRRRVLSKRPCKRETKQYYRQSRPTGCCHTDKN